MEEEAWQRLLLGRLRSFKKQMTQEFETNLGKRAELHLQVRDGEWGGSKGSWEGGLGERGLVESCGRIRRSYDPQGPFRIPGLTE